MRDDRQSDRGMRADEEPDLTNAASHSPRPRRLDQAIRSWECNQINAFYAHASVKPPVEVHAPMVKPPIRAGQSDRKSLLCRRQNIPTHYWLAALIIGRKARRSAISRTAPTPPPGEREEEGPALDVYVTRNTAFSATEIVADKARISLFSWSVLRSRPGASNQGVG